MAKGFSCPGRPHFEVETVRLIFLVYVPRSGSTLLSRLLSESLGNCVVLPELRIPREIFRAEGASGRPLHAADIRKIIAADHQASSLGLEPDEWERCIAASDGKGARRFLEEIARSAAHGRDVEGAIFKCGSVRHFWPAVQRLCRDAEAIHIYRDPRGVVSSTMRSERPHYPGQRMGRGNPWFITKKWTTCMEWARRVNLDNPRFHEIKFEELCSREQETFDNLIQTIQLSADGAGPTLAIDPRESTIHKKVHQDPDTARTDAWVEELPPHVGRTVEWLAGRTLEARGYQPHFTVGVHPLRRYPALANAWLINTVRSAEHHAWVRSERGNPDRSTE